MKRLLSIIFVAAFALCLSMGDGLALSPEDVWPGLSPGEIPSDSDAIMAHSIQSPIFFKLPYLLPDPLPDFDICLADAQVTFSKAEEGDYAGAVRIDKDDNTYKVVLYGKLLKGYGDIEKTLGQAFSLTGPYKDQKIVVWYINPVTAMSGLLPAACNIVPGTEGDEKPAFRCSISLEVPVPSGKSHADILETLASFENTKIIFTAYPHATQCAFPKEMSALYAEADAADSDADGVPDSLDNCPEVANYNQDAGACATEEEIEEEVGPITDPGLGSYVPADGSGDVSDSPTAASGEGFCSMALTPAGTGALPLVMALIFLAIRRRRRS